MKSQVIQTAGRAGGTDAWENPALTKRSKVKNFQRVVLVHVQNKTSLRANCSPQAVCIPWLVGGGRRSQSTANDLHIRDSPYAWTCGAPQVVAEAQSKSAGISGLLEDMGRLRQRGGTRHSRSQAHSGRTLKCSFCTPSECSHGPPTGAGRRYQRPTEMSLKMDDSLPEFSFSLCSESSLKSTVRNNPSGYC